MTGAETLSLIRKMETVGVIQGDQPYPAQPFFFPILFPCFILVLTAQIL